MGATHTGEHSNIRMLFMGASWDVFRPDGEGRALATTVERSHTKREPMKYSFARKTEMAGRGRVLPAGLIYLSRGTPQPIGGLYSPPRVDQTGEPSTRAVRRVSAAMNSEKSQTLGVLILCTLLHSSRSAIYCQHTQAVGPLNKSNSRTYNITTRLTRGEKPGKAYTPEARRRTQMRV